MQGGNEFLFVLPPLNKFICGEIISRIDQIPASDTGHYQILFAALGIPSGKDFV